MLCRGREEVGALRARAKSGRRIPCRPSLPARVPLSLAMGSESTVLERAQAALLSEDSHSPLRVHEASSWTSVSQVPCDSSRCESWELRRGRESRPLQIPLRTRPSYAPHGGSHPSTSVRLDESVSGVKGSQRYGAVGSLRRR